MGIFRTVNWRNLLFKAANTAWQAFAVVFILPDDWWDLGAWESMAIAALAAGLSGLKTFVSEWLKSQLSS